MRLSKNFTLSELTRSQTAARRVIDNHPTPEEIQNLTLLCTDILQPVRDRFGLTVISSGYRSPELNKAIGGSPRSQHSKGQAADFEVPGVSNLEVAAWISQNLIFDQLILEGFSPHEDNSGWVHCSLIPTNNRMEQLTATFTNNGTLYASTNLAGLHGRLA